MWRLNPSITGADTERILVIAPHPDDEVLGCGGTIARAVDAGHEVTIAIVTRGWEPLFSDEYVDNVMAESERAASVLGVEDWRAMGLPVVKLDQLPKYDINDAFNDLVKDVEPTVALLPFPSDRHEDHRQVFDACMVAMRPLQDRLQLHSILCYETVSETHWAMPYGEQGFEPQVYVDVTDFLERKLDAMRCYASQVREPPDARSLKAIESLATWRGSVVGMHAAEAFVLVRGRV